MKYSEMDDAKLIELTRKSDMAAYAALWERHATAALKVANSFSRTITPDDLVSEAYVNILETINRGHGPTTDFRPYLLGTVRNIVSRVAAKSKEDTFEDLEAVVDARQDGGIDTFYAGLDNKALVLDAFSRLTLQEQTILWRAEIEGLKHREIAAIEGTSVGAASVALFRARESLKDAWVQAHLSAGNCPEECEWAFSQLGAYSRQRLKKKESIKTREHLERCDFCPRVLTETQEISGKLHISLVPTALVASGAIGVGAIGAVTGGLHAAAAAAMTVKTVGALSALPTYLAGYTPAIAAVAGATVIAGSLVGITSIAPEFFSSEDMQTSSETTFPHAEGSNAAQDATGNSDAAGEISADERQNDGGTNADSSSENQPDESAIDETGENDAAGESGATSEDPKLDLLLPDWWQHDQENSDDGILSDKIHDGSLSKSLTFGFPAGTSFSTASPLLVGQAHPGDRVQVFVHGFIGEYSRDVVANAVGGWSLRVGKLSGESYFADISVTDAKGNVVDRNVMKFGVRPDAQTSPPVISGVDLDGPIRTVTGKGTPGATVRLYVNDLMTEGYVSDKGVWAIQVERGWKQLLNVLTAVQVNPTSRLTSEVGKPLLVWSER